MKKTKDFGPEFFMYLLEGTREKEIKTIQFCLNTEGDPLTYEEAIKSHDSSFWKEVIQEEMDSIMWNNTWVLVDLPPGSKPIGSKWIFKKKMKLMERLTNLRQG